MPCAARPSVTIAAGNSFAAPRLLVMDAQKTRVFAAVSPEKMEIYEAERRAAPLGSPRPGELRVTGTAELCYPADRASVRVRVSSSKESINEASNSVSRRLDYILQCFRQQGVKDKDTLMRKFLQREEDQYHVNAEVTVAFSDFTKMEQVCRALLEKLDKNVTVGLTHYYHSPECLSQLRTRVCTSAVENAKKKATEISLLLGQTLGPPLLVVEEEIREVHNDFFNVNELRPSTNLSIPSVTASSCVSITFGIKDKVKL
ncbi:hypothetical protein WMY93_015767 [Mugilogobius chulae]|uniref:Interleukin-1 receptor-associated kinase 1-binding protein 1 n=1 Tax=Mugilogobius chulae TaxID=88201 RepID=A0AAW0P2B6_9GOBI